MGGLKAQVTACREGINDRLAGEADKRGGFCALLDGAIRQIDTGFNVADDDFLLVATHGVTEQKGLDLFADESVADVLFDSYAQLKVVLAGAPNDPANEHSQGLLELTRRRPERALYIPWWTPELERFLLRYADALLMPSRWEPCGTTQMVAMRYYCVPLAHKTGGLADTITSVTECAAHGPDPPEANGFLFDVSVAFKHPDFDTMAKGALRERAEAMLQCYSEAQAVWAAVVRNGYDRASGSPNGCKPSGLSWEVSAREYAERFRDLRGMS
jgi:glycogen synthase